MPTEDTTPQGPQLYASLIGPLQGLMFPLPFDRREIARAALCTSKLRHLWCEIYSADEVKQQVEKYGATVLGPAFRHRLDYDSYQVQRAQDGMPWEVPA